MYSTPWQPWHIVQGLGLWPKDLATLAKGPRHSAIVFLRYKPYMDARRSNPDQVLMFAGACWHSSPPARAPHPSLHTSGRPRARTRGRGSHEGGGHRRWALRRRASRWARWARFLRRRRASRPLRRRSSRRSWARRPPHRPCHACSRRASPHLASSSRCVARARRAARAASERTGRATPFASAFRLRRAGSRA